MLLNFPLFTPYLLFHCFSLTDSSCLFGLWLCSRLWCSSISAVIVLICLFFFLSSHLSFLISLFLPLASSSFHALFYLYSSSPLHSVSSVSSIPLSFSPSFHLFFFSISAPLLLSPFAGCSRKKSCSEEDDDSDYDITPWLVGCARPSSAPPRAPPTH